jgi:hypothetical protein
MTTFNDMNVYNIAMSTVIIHGPERAVRAGTWAEKNILNKWDLDFVGSNPFSAKPEYAFKFANSKDATLFALKWVK